MRIRTRLLSVQLLASLILIIAVLTLLQWRFESQFRDYILQRAQQKHQLLLDRLAAGYREQGNWSFLQHNPQELQNIVRRSLGLPGPGADFHDGPMPRRPRPLGLIDQNQRLVAGQSGPDATLLPIGQPDRPVGWLAIPPRRDLLESNDIAFRQSQRETLFGVMLMAIVISVITAVLLSRQLVRPIQQLAAATHRLSRGDYETRLQLGGGDELTQLGEDVNSLAKTLTDNEQARQRWIADISHELRTPLAILKGEIEAMTDGIRPLNQSGLASLQQEAAHLEKLVEDLYQLTSTDIGGWRYQPESVDLCELVAEVCDRFRHRFAEQSLTLETILADSAVKVFADPTRLLQLFENLLENEIRYATKGGMVRLSAEANGSRALLTVEDSGPGVAPEARAHLFDYLYRADSSRNRELGGSGLGLAICERIATAHNGQIEAGESRLGGLLIRLSLPLHRGEN